MGYSFMTIQKIKTTAQIAAKYKHNYRETEVPNADPELRDQNEELVSLHGQTYNEAFQKRMEELGYRTSAKSQGEKKIRKNAVLGFEVVTTFSREDAKHMDFEKWKENNVAWLRKAFNADPERYGDNVLSVVYHADEPGNVHCHAFIIPIDDKGNLNARYYVQNRGKMIALQNSYSSLMEKEHDLKRGISGSRARHQDIKRFYAALNQTVQKELPKARPNETSLEYRKRVNPVYQDAELRVMGLEDQLKRLQQTRDQEIRNAVSEERKTLYSHFQDQSDELEELTRNYGSKEEIEEKCENYENLIRGIAVEEQKEDLIQIFHSLIDLGKEEKEKEKRQKEENLR